MLAAVVGLIGTALLAVIGWAFTLHSRVAVLEADKLGLREIINVRLQGIENRLERIETKLDQEHK